VAGEREVSGLALYFFLKSLARSLILPPAGPLLLAAIAMVLIRRGRRWGWWLLVLAVGGLWLLSTPRVAQQLAGLAEGYPPLNPDRPIQAQAIVVLGGGAKRMAAPEYGGPMAAAVLMDRLAYGAYLARRTSLPVLVTGAPEEAVTMKVTLWRSFGVQTRWVEARSRDTYENARFTAQMLFPAGVRRIVLVTSSTHMWRAAHEFMAAGFAVVPAPEGEAGDIGPFPYSYVPSPAALAQSNAALYELLGEAARRVLAASGVRERFDRQAARVPGP